MYMNVEPVGTDQYLAWHNDKHTDLTVDGLQLLQSGNHEHSRLTHTTRDQVEYTAPRFYSHPNPNPPPIDPCLNPHHLY